MDEERRKRREKQCQSCHGTSSDALIDKSATATTTTSRLEMSVCRETQLCTLHSGPLSVAKRSIYRFAIGVFVRAGKRHKSALT